MTGRCAPSFTAHCLEGRFSDPIPRLEAPEALYSPAKPAIFSIGAPPGHGRAGRPGRRGSAAARGAADRHVQGRLGAPRPAPGLALPQSKKPHRLQRGRKPQAAQTARSARRNASQHICSAKSTVARRARAKKAKLSGKKMRSRHSAEWHCLAILVLGFEIVPSGDGARRYTFCQSPITSLSITCCVLSISENKASATKASSYRPETEGHQLQSFDVR
jgi:hypothetical protein